MWKKAQQWEQDWWGSCVNSYGEEEKQLLYASRMGLVTFHNGKSPYNFNLNGKFVLDIGGGPTSLLLKCVNVKGKVIDPISMPSWVLSRYHSANIEFEQLPGEKLDETNYNEVWIYNVLQHTRNPQQVIENAKQAGKTIRLFEWINTPVNEGHLHTLTEERLNEWLNGKGKMEQLTGQANCYGLCYYGIFPTGENCE